MVKNDNIRIKQKKSDFLLYGFAYLFLILAGIFLIGLPFLSIAPESGAACVVFLIVGILFAAGGGTLYGILIYRGLCPKDALIITNKGFTNRLIGGKDGVYVEWVNVASMKVFGLTKSPMLGLTLTDNDSYIASLDSKAAKDARANLELGLPVIAVSQRDVFLPIADLKNLFSRMIKGAISWEHYSTQGKKSELQPTAEAAENGFKKPDSLATEPQKHFETPAEEPAPVEQTPAEQAAKTAEFSMTKTRVMDAPVKKATADDNGSDDVMLLDMDSE